MSAADAKAVIQGGPVPAADWLLLVVLSFLYGSSFFFYKVLAPMLPPLSVVTGRLAVAAVALDLVLLVARRGAIGRLPWRLAGWFLLLGALNCALPFSLFAWSEHRLSSGMAAILNAPTPILTALVAHVLTRDERLSARMVAGAVCGLAGVVLLLGPSLLQGFGSADLASKLACLAASLAYAFGGVLSRRVRGVTPLQFAAGQVTGGALLMLPLAAVADRFWTMPAVPVAGIASLLGLGLLGTAMAYLLYFRILASSGATRASLVTFLVPVSALLLGGLILGERLPLRALPGVVLIAVGLAVIDGRLLRLGRSGRVSAGAS